jgi:2-polyprenyl-3-methyl-5-hydroxy-6-metoxy-1,4-benzoquinol methylase
MLDHACYFNEAWGVDFSEKTIEKAHELYPNVKYICADVCDTGIQETFDTVIAGEVIEHLENPSLLLEEMDRLCMVGGRMILSTPTLEFQDPEHLWEFTEDDFKLWGFKTEKINSDRFPGRSYIFAYKVK